MTRRVCENSICSSIFIKRPLLRRSRVAPQFSPTISELMLEVPHLVPTWSPPRDLLRSMLFFVCGGSAGE